MTNKRKIDYIEKNFPEEEITKIFENTKENNSEDISNFVNTCITKIGPEGILQRWEQIRQMLFHLNERINYWENRRTQFLQIGLGILGASLAGVVAIFANIKELSDLFITSNASNVLIYPTAKGIVYLFIFILCTCFVFGSLKLVNLWNRQNNPNYPFTKGYRVWLWHYRHAEEIPSDARICRYTKQKFKEEVNNFCHNIVSYKKRFLQSSINDMIDQDLSQVYLLLINEKYKIKMVSALRDLFINMLKISIFISLALTSIFSILKIYINILELQ